MTPQETINLLGKPGGMPELTDQAQLGCAPPCQLQKICEALFLTLETRRKLEKNRAAMRT